MPQAPSVARILAEAERRFAAGGYGATSLSSIARAAGLGNAGLLHHFPSKAALYRAVLEDVGADMDRRIGEALAESSDPGERLRALARVLVELGVERPTALRLVLHEFLDDSDRIDRARALPLAGAVREAVTVVVDGQGAGLIIDGDPLAIVARLHGTVIYGTLGRGVLGRVHGDPGPQWSERLVEIAMAGLLH